MSKSKDMSILYILDEFYNHLDEKLIFGSKCNACEKVFFPPKSSCPVCSEPIVDLIELPSTGIIKNFIKVPHDKKQIYGLIQLDQTDSTIIMRILNAKKKNLQIGMSVKVVWATGKLVNSPHIIGFEPNI